MSLAIVLLVLPGTMATVKKAWFCECCEMYLCCSSTFVPLFWKNDMKSVILFSGGARIFGSISTIQLLKSEIFFFWMVLGFLAPSLFY